MGRPLPVVLLLASCSDRHRRAARTTRASAARACAAFSARGPVRRVSRRRRVLAGRPLVHSGDGFRRAVSLGLPVRDGSHLPHGGRARAERLLLPPLQRRPIRVRTRRSARSGPRARTVPRSAIPGARAACRAREGYACAAGGLLPLVCVDVRDLAQLRRGRVRRQLRGLPREPASCATRATAARLLRAPRDPEARVGSPALDDDGVVLLVGGREVIRYPRPVTESRGVDRFVRWNPADDELHDAHRAQRAARAPERGDAERRSCTSRAAPSDPDVQGRAPDVASTHVLACSPPRALEGEEHRACPRPSIGGTVAVSAGKLFLFPGEMAAASSNRRRARLPHRTLVPGGPHRADRAHARGGGERTASASTSSAAGTARGARHGRDPSSPRAAGRRPRRSRAVAGASVAVADGRRLFVFGGREGPGIGDARAWCRWSTHDPPHRAPGYHLSRARPGRRR